MSEFKTSIDGWLCHRDCGGVIHNMGNGYFECTLCDKLFLLEPAPSASLGSSVPKEHSAPGDAGAHQEYSSKGHSAPVPDCEGWDADKDEPFYSPKLLHLLTRSECWALARMAHNYLQDGGWGFVTQPLRGERDELRILKDSVLLKLHWAGVGADEKTIWAELERRGWQYDWTKLYET